MMKAIEILKQNQLSVTMARKLLLEVFLQSKRPLTVKDIKRMGKLSAFNESSIYRNLSKLEKAQIIHVVPKAGECQYFELLPENGNHHHHISCTQCNTIECLDMCGFDKHMEGLADRVNFLLTGHSVELMGICHKCRE